MDSGNEQSRLILLVLSMSLFCALLGVGIITPLLPIYASRLGIGGPILGVILGIFSFSRTGAMLVSGELAERFDKKRLLMMGLSIYTMSSMGYLLAQTSLTLMLVRFFHGLGSALVVPVALAIGAESAPAGKEGAFLGTLQTALFMGIGSGPLISGILTDHLGWNSSFFAMAFMTAFALLTVMVKLPNQTMNKLRPERTNPLPHIRKMLRDPVLKVVTIFHFSSAMARGSLLMLLPLLAAELKMSFFQIGVLVSLNSLATAFCQRFFGKLSDDRGRVPIIVWGGIISAIVFFLLPFSRKFVPLAFLSILFGLGRSASSPALTALVAIRGKIFGSGRTMGLYNMAFSAGMMTGPILGGFISEFAGTNMAFCTIGICLLASLTMFLPYFSSSEVEFHSIEPDSDH